MSDSFEFTLHSPLTKEDWNIILDAELENTVYVTFQTPQGRQVRYIKCDVFDKIRDEIEEIDINITYQENKNRKASWGLRKVLEIIDKYKAESEEDNGRKDNDI